MQAYSAGGKMNTAPFETVQSLKLFTVFVCSCCRTKIISTYPVRKCFNCRSTELDVYGKSEYLESRKLASGY
jgi:Zn finger protein HypA/HybF involved in hydrogenase expression